MRTKTRLMIAPALLVFFLSSLVVSGPVAAQDRDDEPLRLVYLNTAGSDGRDSFRVIEGILDDSDQIDLVRTRDFWRVAEDFGLDEDSFRRSEEREANMDEFARLMRRAEVEGVLVHDVFGGGGTLQIVVLGPQGFELADIRQSIRRGRIDQDGAMVVLREVFTALVPEVRGFRRQLDEERRQQEELRAAEEEAAAEEAVEEEQLSVRERAIAEHRRRYGNLEQNVAGRIGPLIGYRNMRMDQPQGNFIINHVTPLFGVALRIDGLITTLERDTAAVEAEAFVSFAPFSTAFGDQSLSGNYLRAGADVRYIKAISATARWRAFAGLETTNFSLDPNDQYTGHGYLLGRVGGGLHYRFGSLMTFELDALLLPIAIASNSGGAYGPSQGWLGFGAELGVHINLFEPVLVGINYGFQYLDIGFPEPVILDAPMQSVDMVHNAMISVGYRL